MSALTPGAAETRVWQKSFAPLESRQAEAFQTAGLHQENAGCGYELAPESLLAAKGAEQLEFDFAKGLGPAPKPVYPPNNGFAGNYGPATLVPGTRIDRFGSDFGRFVSPEGTPFIQRSLPSSSASAPYSVFEVVKPFEVQAGNVAPWFGMPGKGVQYQFSTTVNDLINGGYLRPVLRVNP